MQLAQRRMQAGAFAGRNLRQAVPGVADKGGIGVMNQRRQRAAGGLQQTVQFIDGSGVFGVLQAELACRQVEASLWQRGGLEWRPAEEANALQMLRLVAEGLCRCDVGRVDADNLEAASVLLAVFGRDQRNRPVSGAEIDDASAARHFIQDAMPVVSNPAVVVVREAPVEGRDRAVAPIGAPLFFGEALRHVLNVSNQKLAATLILGRSPP